MALSPHNFPKSPVEEVVCSFSPGKTGKPVEIRFPSPYPGWQAIRVRIRDVISSVAKDEIHSCCLTYTDAIPLFSGEHPEDLLPVIPRVPGVYAGRLCSGPEISFSVESVIPDTILEVWCRREEEQVILICTVSGETGVNSRDSLLQWFDRAREEIHLMFDALVTGKVLDRFS
ncbi:MAG: hypothetical protein LUQ07_05655 [Methanospirillum sp.]|nr:hypothetical protein [Methanospirillum sp.]